MPEPLVAYHGTDACSAMIEAEGLRAVMHDGPSPCVWLALTIEEAEHYGRDIWEVDLSQLSGAWPIVLDKCDGVVGESSWQAHYGGDVPPSALRRLDRQ